MDTVTDKDKAELQWDQHACCAKTHTSSTIAQIPLKVTAK